MAMQIRFTAAALADEEAAIHWYLQEAGAAVAERFANALGDSYQLIVANPEIGSLRHAHFLDIPGLRTAGVKRFPYIVFYLSGKDDSEVVRVLHTRQDSSTLGGAAAL